MRKVFLLSLSAVMLAVGMMFTSCRRSDDPVFYKATLSNIRSSYNNGVYFITLKSNVEATFTVGSQTKTGREVVFEVTDPLVGIKAVIDGVEYIATTQATQVASNAFKSHSTVNLYFFKPSDNAVPQSEIKGKTLTNSTENQQAVGDALGIGSFTPSVTFPNNLIISGNTTDPFSVTATVPTPILVEKFPEVGEKLELPFLAFDFSPEGAIFNQDIPMSFNLGTDAAGMTLKLKDPNTGEEMEEKVGNDGSFSYGFDHTPAYDVFMEVEAKNKKEGTVSLFDKNLEIAAGSNSYNFTLNGGFQTEEQNLPKYIMDALTSIFGDPYYTTPVTGSFDSNIPSEAKVDVKQSYIDYVLEVGGRQVHVKVWGPYVMKITPDNGSPYTYDSHSGGGGR